MRTIDDGGRMTGTRRLDRRIDRYVRSAERLNRNDERFRRKLERSGRRGITIQLSWIAVALLLGLGVTALAILI